MRAAGAQAEQSPAAGPRLDEPGRQIPPPRGQKGVDRDELLVARARRGERHAVEKLLGAHRPRVLAIARRIVGDPDEAEDVAQEVLSAVVRALATFRGGATFTTWLHRVATNHALNHLRAVNRRGHGEGRAAVEITQDRQHGDAAQAPQRLEDHERREVVREAIRSLDPLFQLCVLLRDVEGLSYEEIAERTRLPRGTVKSRIHRARTRIRQSLEPARDPRRLPVR